MPFVQFCHRLIRRTRKQLRRRWRKYTIANATWILPKMHFSHSATVNLQIHF